MTKVKFSLIAVVLFLVIAGIAFSFNAVSAGMQDRIEYNAVYDCGDSRPKFKVLSCKGIDKSDTCKVYTIKESSPGGGYESSVYRNIIEDTYIKREGCKTKNSPSSVTKQKKTNRQKTKRLFHKITKH